MGEIESSKKCSAAALMLASLTSCVGPSEITSSDLHEYDLTPRSVPAEPQISPALEGLSVPVVEALWRASCEAHGLTLCVGDDLVRALSQTAWRHDLTATSVISGSSTAGSFHLHLFDESLDAADSVHAVRQGTVEGEFDSAIGLSFPASGKFLLTRNERFEQLTFQLQNSATVRLDGQFTRPINDGDRGLIYFKISTGLLADVFGVPESHSEIHIPVTTHPGGILHFSIRDSEVDDLLSEACSLRDNDDFDYEAVRESLKIVAPFSISAFEPQREFSRESEFILQQVGTLLTMAVDGYGLDVFPKVSLLVDRTPGEETKQTIALVSLGVDRAYFVVPSSSEEALGELCEVYQSLQLLDGDSGLCAMHLGEFRDNLYEISP